MKKPMVLVVLLSLIMFSASAGTINAQSYIDGVSKPVITPKGIFWHHIQPNTAKPGYCLGPTCNIQGPIYADGVVWMPTWSTPGNGDAGVSAVFPLDVSGHTGWSLSSRCDLHSGDDGGCPSVTASTYDAHPSIKIIDPQSGCLPYSLDLQVPSAPDTTPLSATITGAADEASYSATSATIDIARTAPNAAGNFAADTLAVTYDPVPPVVAHDYFTAVEDTPLTAAAPGVLANDTHPNGLPMTAVLENGPVHGSVTLNPDGSFTYTPAGYTGPDWFTYRATDGTLSSAVGIAYVWVAPSTPGYAFVAVATGGSHTVALKNDGTVWAWGRNDWGQLGNGTTARSSVPIQVTSLTGVTAIAAQYVHTVALRNDGTVWAWGRNDGGQLGNGTTNDSSVPVQVTNLTGVTAVAAGDGHTVAVRNDGTVWAWGCNGYGQLGNGTATYSSVPVQVTNLTGVTAVAAGWGHTIALKNDGTVWAWGLKYGSVPVQVSDLTGVTAIAAGWDHTVALRNDGTVWAWGWNSYGQLGNGTTNDSSVPVQVSNLTGVTAVAAGTYHTVALRNDGTVRAWGYNDYGQLGNGTRIDSSVPVQVTNLTGVTAVAAGYSHTVALRNDGTVWAWGYNSYGQLGNGTTNDSSVPVQAPNLTGVTAVAAGYSHTVALRNDGTVWAWGYNSFGQLGNGTRIGSSVPVQVRNLAGVTAVAAGSGHTVALKNDGTVWAWGYNFYGQLGNGTTTHSSVPVQVTNLTGVTAVAAGWNHTVALKNDGTVRAWGWNNCGQLGYGWPIYPLPLPVVCGGIAISITSPTSEPTCVTNASAVGLSGAACSSGTITSITWSNNRGGSGDCTGTISWSAGGVPLQPGDNVITVTIYNNLGYTASDVLTVTCDPTPPSVAITSPTDQPAYSTTFSTISLAGTASDNVGIASVTWSNDRGGSGSCTGTMSWSVAGVRLQPGDNLITVTAYDTAGNFAADTLAVHSSAAAITIPEAKLSGNDAPVTLEAKVVTYAGADFFYVEEDSRCTGIRVEKTAHGLTVGMRVNVNGTMKTNAARERYILAASATQTPEPNAHGTLAPVGVNNLALGGGDWRISGTGGQRGVTGAVGLNNIGLLVKTTGRFYPVDATAFDLDDGSGVFVRCRVPVGTFIDPSWQYVTVTGISSMWKYNNYIYLPCVLVRETQNTTSADSSCETIYVPAGTFLMENDGGEP